MSRVYNFLVGVWEGIMVAFIVIAVPAVFVAAVTFCVNAVSDKPQTIIIKLPATTTTTVPERLCEPSRTSPLGIPTEVCR